MKPWCATTQMKATEQYFHAILFVLRYCENFKLDVYLFNFERLEQVVKATEANHSVCTIRL